MSQSLNRRAALGWMSTASTLALSAVNADAGSSPPSPATSLPGPSPSEISVPGGVFHRATGAEAIVSAFQAEGVPCVFGIPGAQNNELWDVMKSRGLPYLLVTHEFSASVMADASARVTGRVGVFSVVPGPGLTNALTGMGEAMLDSVPIVGLVTDVDRTPGAPAYQVHDLPGASILRPVCKAVIEVQHEGQIPLAIHQAFRVARCGEPGPAAVVIPYVLLNRIWNYEHLLPLASAAPFDESAYHKALCLLSDRRKRVGIYAGMGTFAASDSLAAAAELLQAPVATSVSGKGALPDSHRLAVGWGYGPFGTRAAETAFQDVDVVLAVGVRYSEVSTANYSIPRHDCVIHVDANARNLGRNVHATVGVHSDSEIFFQRLLADAPAVRRSPDPALWAKIRSQREVDHIQQAQALITHCVDPMHFLHHLGRALCPEDLFFMDVSASSHWASEAIPVHGPRRYFAPTNNQSMGWAIPASIAGQLVAPNHRVACVTGDGCFLMSGMEISTAVRAALPVKFFVFDDGAYHYMQMLQQPVYRRTNATEIANLNFGAFAAATRMAFNEIGSNADIVTGIARAFRQPGPVLTRVVVSYDGREIRWLSALKKTYLDKLKTAQKLRMGTRVAARSVVKPMLEND